jgi:hypothetical protein
MLKIFLSERAKKLNFFPAKHGSPRMILHHCNVDYQKHCKYVFGTYVQGHDDSHPKNTSAPTTLDCIYLQYLDSMQGGHELLHSATNRIIMRQYVTEVPITSTIIQQIHDIANIEGMPKGLKVKNFTNQIFYDAAWIA